jgi:cyclophilin family peptidyl-prolyl cis-trans isomerase
VIDFPMKKKANSKKAKSKRRSTKKRSLKLDFQPLEPRQLLAGDVAGIHQADVTLPTGINLIQNGNLYAEGEVEGWDTFTGLASEEFNLFNYSDDYTSVLDLDSTVATFDRVTQDIDTSPGEQYLLTFDFRAHPAANENPTANSYDFEVWWNGTLQAIYTGADIWQTGGLLVTGGDGDTTQLLLCEVSEGASGGGDGLGALLDNIRLVKANAETVGNGSFETTNEDKTQFFLPYEVDSWGAMGTDIATRLIQVETNDFGTTDGDQFLNLDSADTQRDIVFQDVATVAGATYYVKFDVRSDGAQDDNSDELRVRWNNQWATTINPDADWQSHTIMVNADSDLTRLTFLEPGDGNNGEGSGPWIDNVQLLRVDAVATNDAPTVTPVADQSAEFGQALDVAVEANDPNGDDITYTISAAGIPAGNNVPTISDTGAVSWIPSSAGNFELTVTATDSEGVSDNTSFDVNVADFVPFSGTGALSDIPVELRNDIYSEAPAISIDTSRNFEARFTTTDGNFSINLFAADAPETVNNFVNLARDGFYDGVEFHRVLEGFVGQGGDPTGTGSGGPGYEFGDETDNGRTFSENGLLAMANAGPGTNGSQFFITFETPTHLNGNHTIFGELVGDISTFTPTFTHTSTAGGEIPIPGAVHTIIESITIHVT